MGCNSGTRVNMLCVRIKASSLILWYRSLLLELKSVLANEHHQSDWLYDGVYCQVTCSGFVIMTPITTKHTLNQF